MDQYIVRARINTICRTELGPEISKAIMILKMLELTTIQMEIIKTLIHHKDSLIIQISFILQINKVNHRILVVVSNISKTIDHIRTIDIIKSLREIIEIQSGRKTSIKTREITRKGLIKILDSRPLTSKKTLINLMIVTQLGILKDLKIVAIL